MWANSSLDATDLATKQSPGYGNGPSFPFEVSGRDPMKRRKGAQDMLFRARGENSAPPQHNADGGPGALTGVPAFPPDLLSVKAVGRQKVPVTLATGNVHCFTRAPAVLIWTSRVFMAENGGAIFYEDGEIELLADISLCERAYVAPEGDISTKEVRRQVQDAQEKKGQSCDAAWTKTVS